MEKLKILFIRYKGFILYVFFGIATTLVNIVTYYVCTEIIFAGNVVSNIFAWIFAVTFAYFTNRIWVFESDVKEGKGVIREALFFYTCRFLTGFLDLAVMFVFVDLVHVNGMLMKCISNVLVIVVNYVASKFVIFKRTR